MEIHLYRITDLVTGEEKEIVIREALLDHSEVQVSRITDLVTGKVKQLAPEVSDEELQASLEQAFKEMTERFDAAQDGKSSGDSGPRQE